MFEDGKEERIKLLVFCNKAVTPSLLLGEPRASEESSDIYEPSNKLVSAHLGLGGNPTFPLRKDLQIKLLSKKGRMDWLSFSVCPRAVIRIVTMC